jgi:hypothetical protein
VLLVQLTLSLKQQQLAKGIKRMANGLYANMNARKKKGTSRSKKDSTVSDKAYKNMKAGFPKKKTLLKKDK